MPIISHISKLIGEEVRLITRASGTGQTVSRDGVDPIRPSGKSSGLFQGLWAFSEDSLNVETRRIRTAVV
ncbi:hypothetical protein BM1_04261 [Bipolaris maydis]|nr:hypothetical protein BM1_04261 [Bipolaris maydis]